MKAQTMLEQAKRQTFSHYQTKDGLMEFGQIPNQEGVLAWSFIFLNYNHRKAYEQQAGINKDLKKRPTFKTRKQAFEAGIFWLEVIGEKTFNTQLVNKSFSIYNIKNSCLVLSNQETQNHSDQRGLWQLSAKADSFTQHKEAQKLKVWLKEKGLNKKPFSTRKQALETFWSTYQKDSIVFKGF